MHTPACTYCRDRDEQAHLDALTAWCEREAAQRDALTVGELRDAVLGECSDAERMTVARIGEDLFGLALSFLTTYPDAEGAEEFIEEARGVFGPLADANWMELGSDYQNLRGVGLHPYRAHDPG